MARGHRASGGRFGADFSYRDWASTGFRFEEPDAGGPDEDEDVAPEAAS